MNLNTVKCFARAIKYGSKYVYQTVPRLLTLWLDLGEDKRSAATQEFTKLNKIVADAIKVTPVCKVRHIAIKRDLCRHGFQWFTAFPQIVSRVGHQNAEVFPVLSKLIMLVIQEYPKQSLWLFASVVKSTKPQREQRGKQILQQIQVRVNQCPVNTSCNVRCRPIHTTQALRCPT